MIQLVQRHYKKILVVIALATVFATVAGAGCLTISQGPPGSIPPDISQGSTLYPGVSRLAPPSNPNQDGKIQVVTSFRPFTLLVGPIGGDHVTITQILPPGADPHEYEPTPNDAVALKDGRIFFYAGPSLEPWAADLATSSNPDIQRVTFADAIPEPVYDQMKSQYANFPDMTQDPHLWLSPQLTEYYADYVARRLSETDPQNASDYQNNAAVFEKRLQQLDSDYSEGFSNCTTRSFLSSHSFLGYIASAYNLTQISISGMSPDAQPSLKQMSAVIEESKAHNVRGILTEPDEAEDLSKSISAELSLPVYYITTMEVLPAGPLTEDDTDYVAIMENNLHEMKKAMLCQ